MARISLIEADEVAKGVPIASINVALHNILVERL